MTLLRPPVLHRLAAAPRSGPLTVLEAPVDVDALTFVRSGADLFGSAFYVGSPAGERIGGFGRAWTASAAGPERFASVRRSLAELPGEAVAMLGYSFSDTGPLTETWSGFGAVDAVVPTAAVHTGPDGRSVLRLSLPDGGNLEDLLDLLGSLQTPADPLAPDLGDHVIESHPHVSDWRREVGDAVAAIRSGLLEKVVLARSVVVRSTVPAQGFDLMHHLVHAYPGCYSFAWAAGDAVFIGSSPELLLEVRGTSLRTNPLAGSAARGEGAVEDRLLGESLLASEKDRFEHAVVVDDVLERVRGHAQHVDVPGSPTLRQVATVQHLSTEITGSLRQGTQLLDVLADLHPTPAVGGTPRDEATGFIEKVEGIDRGWYTGGIGWVRPNGDGTVALALRCGLLRGPTAHLYAGAGIVGDSDPDLELVETRLKLRPLLELLASG